MDKSNEIDKIKLVLLGDTDVGKTSISTRILKNTFYNYLESTIGASFHILRYNYNNINLIYHIWDTSGQERYRSLCPMYYRDADVVLICYDIANSISFKSVDYWIKELNKT